MFSNVARLSQSIHVQACVNDYKYCYTFEIFCRYGLIMPDKTKKRPIFEASRNVFGNDDDSDDENKSISFTKQKKQVSLKILYY